MSHITKREATNAANRLKKDLRGIESSRKGSPDLTKIPTLGKRYGNRVEKELREERGAVVYGRATEIGQMPYDPNRGYTHDVDVLVSNDERFGKEVKQHLGKNYKIAKDGDSTRTVIRKNGQDVLDIHEHPDGYPIGRGRRRKQYTSAVMPDSNKDFIKTGGIAQEKLHVQARRKAAATMGKNDGTYSGPREHRLKDPYDLVRYSYYLSQQRRVGQARRTRIVRNANTIRDYYAQHDVYSKFTHGHEFGPKFKKLKPRRVVRHTTHSGLFSLNRLNRILF